VTATLEQWLGREYRHAATAMLLSVSARTIVKERPGFGQTVRPLSGSVVASPVLGAYDPDPDYFFHWFRDSAIVIDAVRLLYEAGQLGAEAVTHFADFVRFSLALQELDGRALVATPQWRTRVKPEFEQYLRGDDDLSSVSHHAVYADTRVNPDGTLDISRWGRPQHDGSPLRALTLLKWLPSLSGGHGRADEPVAASTLAAAERLLRIDLALTAAHWREPSLDIWEEELGHHYFTLRVAAAALTEGAEWLREMGEAAEAAALRTEARAIRETLDEFWLSDAGHYRSRVMPAGVASTKLLDIAVILGAVHGGGNDAHSVRDPRMHATLTKLEQLFDRLYPLNRDRPPERGPAMGRYEGDVYYSGGAYYFSTLGAAEFCYLAAARAPDTADRRAWLGRGDAFLETVRAFTPPSGDLSEQFDQRTGEQTSAKHLAWSYAAFISCVTARSAVVAR
jgi:glucoamylase